MLAIVNTIHASHTAGIVNLMVLIVYARSLAALGAKRTVAAFVGIYNRFEKSMARKNAKHRAATQESPPQPKLQRQEQEWEAHGAILRARRKHNFPHVPKRMRANCYTIYI